MRIITTFFLALMLTAGLGMAQQAGHRGLGSFSLKDYAPTATTNSTKLVGKTHVLVAGHATAYTGRAACDTVFAVDFQDGLIPSTWTNLDVDGHTDANGRPQDFYVTVDAQTTTAGDTNFVAAASSWFTPFAKADNWLITDSFTVCDPNLYLVWKSAPFEGPVFADGYKVALSTTGNAPANFTTVLATFAESVNGTATQSAGTVHPNYNGNNGVLTQWQVSLSSYVGSTIYIGFHHDSDDDNLIMLDDIMVVQLPDQELEAVSGDYSSEYPITPLNQVGAYTFSGMIRNNGTMTATACTLGVNVNSGAFTDAGAVATLAAFSDAAVTMNLPFTPSAAAVYNCFFTADMLQSDPVPANDTVSTFFIVSDTTFARDNGVITGALSIGAQATGTIGQEFTITAADTMTSVSFFLTAPSVGDTIIPKVMALNNGVPDDFSPLAVLPMVIISDPNPMMYNIAIPNGLGLSAGTYVVALDEGWNNGMTLGTATTKYTETKGWVYLPANGWAHSEDYGFEVAYVLRANFGNTVNVSRDEVNPFETNVYMFPNPTSDNLSIVFDLDLSNQGVTVNVRDAFGRLLNSSNHMNIAHHRVNLNLSDYASGMYLVEVRSGDLSMTRKIQVMK